MKKLFHGKESYISLKKAKSLFNELKNIEGSVTSITIDCSTSNADSIVGAYKNTDMFSNSKVILLKNLSENKEKEQIIEDLKNSDIGSIDNLNVIFWENKKIASNTHYYKMFDLKKEIDESAELNKRTFITWAKSEIANYDIKIDSDALYELARSVNYDAQSFINEIDKFSLSSDKNITYEMVAESVKDTFEYEIWGLLDAINSDTPDRRSKIMTISENLISNNNDPLGIIAMLARNLRNVLLTKYLLEKGYDSKYISKEVGYPPFNFYNISATARRLQYNRIEYIYEKLTGLDFGSKTGLIDAKLGLTILLANI